MKRKALIAGLMISAACIGPAQSKTPDNAALNAARIINTAEAYAHRDHAKYLPLRDLISTGSLKQAAGMSETFTSIYSELNLQHETELINGFDFALLVSSDGSAYKFSLLQRGNCGPAYFSDERGIIYAGKPLGCAAE